MNFEISDKVNTDKVFLVNKSKLEGRFEPEYYIPVLRKLENKVRKQSTHKLRDFIQGIAGGATPSTTQKDKYYTNKEEGFPFLRVQNLQTNGKVNFDNLKYINEKTHNGLLKRSQVESGDLLIKITGVGRMAIACVAPAGFSGNTNQHMVVVKTGSREVSEYLANYLNLDLVEVLASRRATGATRPALDYQALKSIPIIEDLDFEVIEEAYSRKTQKEAEAKELLNSIDDYLLSELGIELPEKDTNLENRIFEASFKNISGIRFDPDYYSKYYKELEKSIDLSNYDTKELKTLTHFLQGGKTSASSEYSDSQKTEYPIVKVGSYTNNYINLEKVGYTKSANNSIQIEKDDIFILSAAHQAAYVGKHIKILTETPPKPTSYVGELINVRAKKSDCNPMYLFSLLNLEIFKTLINREKTGQTSHVYGKDLQYIRVPAPPIEKQDKIADHIRQLRKRAKQLKKEARQEVENARRQVGEMILEH